MTRATSADCQNPRRCTIPAVTTLISLEDIHKHYGPAAILDGVSLDLEDDHRVAVIGRNGAGKSTLCRLIIGTEEADAGTIHRHEDLRLSWLEQQSPFQEGEVAGPFLERWSGQESWECARLAARFRLTNEHLESPVAELSGGLQTRLRLAGMLLREPNFLILDEPTNYLDLRTLLLLEEFLVNWRGGYLIVSHDRAFLKRTCRQTLEVSGGKAVFYPGPLESFFAHQQSRREQAEHHNAAVEVRRKELEEFIARNKAKASKASQAQSKAKMLDRLQTIEIQSAAAEAVIRIPQVETRSGSVLRTQALAIGYPDRRVAAGIDLDLDRGSKIAVVGDNGQGKSTFLKTVSGVLPGLGGSFTWGHAARIGVYAQHVYSALDERSTIRAHLERCAAAAPGQVTTQQIHDLAGGFLFHGDEIDKRIGVLSGGERARLCLAGLLLGRYDVLLMDEPTNHLDFETVEALAEALSGYNGTLFFTSHDRTFVSMVATRILDVREGTLKLYPDDYASYVWRIERELADSDTDAGKQPPSGKAQVKTDRQKKPNQARPSDRKGDERRLRTLERQLAALEEERTTLTARMVAARGEEARATAARLATVTRELERVEAEWVALGETLERDGGSG